MDISTVSLQELIAWACVAYRYNDYEYVKSSVFGVNNNTKFTNKDLMLSALGHAHLDVKLSITKEDKQLAVDIQKFYRRLLFEVISDNNNDFRSKLYQILESQSVKLSQLGFIACLPHVYLKDVQKRILNKKLDKIDQNYLDSVGSTIYDRDCDIIAVDRSHNYDAHNVVAIVENKLVGWMSKHAAVLGDCVIISANVKSHSENWKYQRRITLLNYVRFAQ